VAHCLGSTHINIVGDPLSLASYKFGKVDHTPRLETRGLLYVNVVMLLLFREYHINIVYDKMMDIEMIKNIARQFNIDMVGKGIPCLLRDVRKYTGNIHRVNKGDGTVVWLLR